MILSERALPTSEVSRGPVLLSVSITATLFAMLMCGVRTAIRLRITRTFGYDDYSIYLAMVMATIGTIFTIIEGLSLNDRIRALQFDDLAQPWLMFGSTLAKISICFFFLRTIGSRRPWNVVLGGLIVVLAVVNLVFALVANLQCQPLEKLWDPSVPGRCFDPTIEVNISYFQGGFAVFTYFFLAAFPVLIVRDMNIIRSVRWPFYCLAGLSLTAGMLSIVRVYESSTPATVTGYTLNTLVATLLAVLEQTVAIVAANLLAVGPLFSERLRESTPGDDNELMLRKISDRDRYRSKRTATFVIERPRKVFQPTEQMPNPSIIEEGRVSSESQESRRSDTNFGTSNAEGAFNAEALEKGILRTISVEVIEEDITETDKKTTRAAHGKNDGEAWRNILRGEPRK